MENLDRKLLNTEIVCMRHDVQRAKVMTLRKMVRRGEKLRAKKGKDQAKAKNERIAERLVEEIQDVKKIRPDEVTKYALVNSEDACQKTISNADTLPEIKAVARIACEKIVVSKIKSLKAKYYNWDDAVTFLQPAPKKGKKPKTEEDKPEDNIPGPGTQTAASPDVEDSAADEEGDEEEGESSESEDGSSENDLEGENDVSRTYSPDASNSDNDGSLSPEPIISTIKNKNKIKINDKQQKEIKTLKPKVNEKLSIKKSIAQDKSKISSGSSSAISVVRKITNLEDLGHLGSLSTSTVGVVNVARKDSFFLGADGEEVESEVEEPNEEDEEDEGVELERGPNSRVYHSRGKPEAQEHRRTFGVLNSKQEWHGSHNKRTTNAPQLKRFDSSQGNRKQQPAANTSRGQAPAKPDVPEKLHPSWEAKRKLKESLQIGKATQNKKIKFDD